MDLRLSADELAFQTEVRAFLAEQLTPQLRRAAKATPGAFADMEVNLAWMAILNAKGWLGYAWPVEAGGTGWTATQRYIFERECAHAHAPPLPAQGLRLLAPVLHGFGTTEQKQRFLPRILSGEHIWCQGYSEPGSGSDLASLRTRAVREGDHYIVDGTKIWTTNAHVSNWIFCLVRTSTEGKLQQGISFLLIDMATPGITVAPIGLISGDRELNQVFFDGVKIPANQRIGEEGQGWTIAKFLLEHERGGSCMAPALLVALAELREQAAVLPSPLGGALADDTDFMARLAMVELEAEGFEMLELRLLSQLARGQSPGPQTALVGLLVADIRQAIDRLVLEAHGTDALQLETARPLYGEGLGAPIASPEARMALPTYLNNRAWSIMAGSSEIMRTLIAKTMLRL